VMVAVIAEGLIQTRYRSEGVTSRSADLHEILALLTC
jgi:hypothetical protein